MTMTVQVTDGSALLKSESYDQKTGSLLGTSYENVGGMANGVVVGASIMSAKHADVSIREAADLVASATKERWDADKKMMVKGTLENEDIAKLNALNKEASIAMAANQQFTALLNKIERVVQTT